MAGRFKRLALSTFEGVIDGATTETDPIPCQFLRAVQLLAYDSTFGGGTLTVEHRPPGASTWFQWSSTALTDDGADTFYPPAGGHIKLVLTGGAGYSINWRLRHGVTEC